MKYSHRAHLICALVLVVIFPQANTCFASLYNLVAQVHATDPEDLTLFGDSIAVDGSLMAVGGGTYDYRNTPESVYIYEVSDPQNVIERRVFSPTAGPLNLEGFGRSVAISGKRVFVGAPNVNGGAGLVHMFDLSDINNIQHRTITAFDAAPQNSFGQSLAVDGNRLVVGAPDYSASVTLPPAVYILDFTDIDNIQQTKIVPDPTDNVGRFGDAVAIDGNYLLVGNTDLGPRGSIGNAGGAHLYDLSDLSQIRNQILRPSDPQVTYAFGRSLSISGTKAVIGAVGDVGPINPPGASSGSAYLFDLSNWSNVTQTEFGLPNGEGSSFGGNSDVEIVGNTVVVGDKNDGGTRGAAFVFDVSDADSITLLGKITAPDRRGEDRFASHLAFDGRSLAVATRRDGVGTAYLFQVPEPCGIALVTMIVIAATVSRRH